MIFDTAQKPALVVPIAGTTPQLLVSEAEEAAAAGADVVEWRMDFLVGAHGTLSCAALANDVVAPILKKVPVPMLLTMRTVGQGGRARLAPGRYRLFFAEMLDTLLHLEADPQRIGIDLEYAFPQTPQLARQALRLGFTVVVSHCDWDEEMPDADMLRLILAEMLELPDVAVKLAVNASAPEDIRRLLAVAREMGAEYNRVIIALPLGADAAGVRKCCAVSDMPAVWGSFA